MLKVATRKIEGCLHQKEAMTRRVTQPQHHLQQLVLQLKMQLAAIACEQIQGGGLFCPPPAYYAISTDADQDMKRQLHVHKT